MKGENGNSGESSNSNSPSSKKRDYEMSSAGSKLNGKVCDDQSLVFNKKRKLNNGGKCCINQINKFI